MKLDHIFTIINEGRPQLAEGEVTLPRNFECLKDLVGHFTETCGRFSDYSLKYVKHLVHHCENLSSPAAVGGIKDKINQACSK